MNILAKFCGKKDVTDPQREKWLNELADVKIALDSNEMLFNMTDDFNLTEYAIHKKSALEARYSYLIRLIRRYDEASVGKKAFNDEMLEKAVTGDNLIEELNI